MCKSQAEGGQRCSAHTHLGVAATHYAGAVTNLDEAQVASVFHRLRGAHKDTPAPSQEEAVTVLTRLKREAAADSRLDERTRDRILSRYDNALAEIEDGQMPEGRTWAAMQSTVVEAEIAERNLDLTVRVAARAQRMNPDRMAAIFRKWRRDTDSYDDMTSPDPSFNLNPDKFPTDKRTQRALRKLAFENYLAQRLPVFTYGTLRNGQGNARLMDGAIAARSEEAHVDGIAVYGPSWGFPYANEAPDGQGVTKGDLVHLLDDQDGDWARGRLDGLEGFNSDRFNDSHYRRVAHNVTYTDPATGQTQQTKAWVYLAGDWSKERCTEDNRIEHGDWVQGKREYATSTGRNRSNMWWDHVNDRDHSGGEEPAEDADEVYSGDYVVRKSAVN